MNRFKPAISQSTLLTLFLVGLELLVVLEISRVLRLLWKIFLRISLMQNFVSFLIDFRMS